MKLKFIISLFFVLFFRSVYSQLLITEVYYNTPYNEKLNFTNDTDMVSANKHHWGEFVEIYNYSDKDVNLKDWYLKDVQGIFWFPEKTIKKGQFMVVAYSTFPTGMTPFTELFTTTAGKQDQIILQDRIILRNKAEMIFLGRAFNEKTLLDKSSYSWSNGELFNFIPDIWQNPAMFYTVKSIQYNPNIPGNFEAKPNPLEATYVPPTQSYDDLVKSDFQQFYGLLDWTNNVSDILDKICLINIEKLSQNPGGSYTEGAACFSYDSAGNLLTGLNCVSNVPFARSKDYPSDELEAIKNSIVISPNPTKASDSYNVTLTWSGPAMNKINNIQVVSSIGVVVYGFSPGNGVYTTTLNLQNQLQGVFIANFVLSTGQVISKNILKW